MAEHASCSDSISGEPHQEAAGEAENKFVLQLIVTEQQQQVIENLFGHCNWKYEECGEREKHGNFDDHTDAPGYVVSQNEELAECTECLCRPYITDVSNKQMWWEDEPQPPHARNSNTRKRLYKPFWTMLYHRQVWQDPRYLERKAAALEQDRLRIHYVWSGGRLHKRDIMPKCVLQLVRSWLPNPTTCECMGNRWV